MEVEASRRSKRKKKDKKHHRSKSKSKKKHRKRQRRSSSSSEEAQRRNEKTSSSAKLKTEIEVDRDRSHQEVVDLVRETLDSLLAADPILDDLPKAVTLEEIQSLIAFEHGQAIQIEVYREDGTTLDVIIHQNATVGQLKRAVERATELKLSRDADHRRRRRINWKYVWKTYWLYAHGVKLKDDKTPVKDCALRNNDRVSFIKRLKEK